METLHRNWRYGLNYYSVEPLPDCKGHADPPTGHPAGPGTPSRGKSVSRNQSLRDHPRREVRTAGTLGASCAAAVLAFDHDRTGRSIISAIACRDSPSASRRNRRLSLSGSTSTRQKIAAADLFRRDQVRDRLHQHAFNSALQVPRPVLAIRALHQQQILGLVGHREDEAAVRGTSRTPAAEPS